APEQENVVEGDKRGTQMLCRVGYLLYAFRIVRRIEQARGRAQCGGCIVDHVELREHRERGRGYQLSDAITLAAPAARWQLCSVAQEQKPLVAHLDARYRERARWIERHERRHCARCARLGTKHRLEPVELRARWRVLASALTQRGQQ